jgi:hypothetical protein
MEVYVDDFIVKIRHDSCLILDLEETFTNVRHFNIRLNPKNAPLGSLGASSWGTTSPRVVLK